MFHWPAKSVHPTYKNCEFDLQIVHPTFTERVHPETFMLPTCKSVHPTYKKYAFSLQKLCFWPIKCVHLTYKKCASTLQVHHFEQLRSDEGVGVEPPWAPQITSRASADMQNDLQALQTHLHASRFISKPQPFLFPAPRFDLCLLYLFVIDLLWLNLPKFNVYLFIIESTIV